MNALKVAVLGLATARLTRLVVEDQITEQLRLDISERAQVAGRGTLIDKVDDAVNCPACTSVWAAGGVLLTDQAGPVGRFLVRVLALSEAALALRTVSERIER